jgi:hypothetical protein
MFRPCGQTFSAVFNPITSERAIVFCAEAYELSDEATPRHPSSWQPVMVAYVMHYWRCLQLHKRSHASMDVLPSLSGGCHCSIAS